MNTIVGEAIVSCYVSAVSFLVMVLMLLLSERLKSRRTGPLRYLFRLTLCVATTCVFLFICNAMYRQRAPWCHTAAIVTRTAREILVVVIVSLWLAFVDSKLYGERNISYYSRYKWLFVPLGLALILLIVNPFTGIVFTYSRDNVLEHKPLLLVIWGIEFLYFCSSAAVVRYYDQKKTKLRFIRVTPMIVSVVLASGVQFFLPYDIGILGYVVGISLLYFSMVTEIRFVDEESELYNKGYLAYLFDLALVGKNNAQSALILEMDGNLPAAFRLLRDVLHQNGDVIRAEEKKFLMFSESADLSTLQYLSSLMDEAVNRYNTEHPQEKVQMTARCRIRTAEESAFEFLRSVMTDKEAGDEMRGIVSMISELNQLDKDLELAADIQISVLPTNFPPFPDRAEFDLYASMRPAREVGGDFYDFFLIDSDHLALVIADVSGKGIPAALFMMVSKTLIKNQLMSGCDPATALERVNLQLCERNSSMMFVTVWAAVLELSTGIGTACNAGHENPGLRRAGGDFELLRYKHNIFLGVNKKAKYDNREFGLSPGDCVFVYTDGVPEATNAASDMFREEKLLETLNQDADAGPEELIRRMHEAVDRFADGAPQFDDITMLCLKYYGAQERKGE